MSDTHTETTTKKPRAPRKTTAKKTAKKAAKKNVGKKVAAKKATGRTVVRKSPEQQKELFRLMKRTNGATMEEIHNAGYKGPAVAAIAMAKRHGHKTKIVVSDVVGERNRYLIVG